jgi:Predicted methylated DNA-protein cysteine methyltransferase
MNEFSKRVAQNIKRIPEGKVATYGLIAMLSGNPRASRIVGYLTHSLKEDLPFHRVVFKDGHICEGSPFGHPEIQRDMLRQEGVAFLPNGCVDLEKSLWLTQE